MYLSEADLGRVAQVGAVPFEVRVGFIADDEDDVGGYLVRRLVTLALERDFGSGLPARFDVDRQNFVLPARRAVAAKDLARNFHLFRAT